MGVERETCLCAPDVKTITNACNPPAYKNTERTLIYGPSCIQRNHKQKRCIQNRKRADWILPSKWPPPSHQNYQYAILGVRVWEGDSRTLPIGVPKIQGAIEETKERSEDGGNASGKLIRISKADKICIQVH